MLVIEVGTDELNFADDPRFIWIAYDYSTDGNDGRGTAYAFGHDGKLYERSLGHCSCDGPLDGDWEETSILPFLEPVSSIFETNLEKAIAELIQAA